MHGERRPSEIRFSLPANRYLKRHQRPPDGAISRYSPRPSKMRCRFEVGLTDSILIRVSIGLGATREFLGGPGGNYLESCPRTTAAVKSFPFRQISPSPGFLPIFIGFLEFSSALESARAKSGGEGKSAPGNHRMLTAIAYLIWHSHRLCAAVPRSIPRGLHHHGAGIEPNAHRLRRAVRGGRKTPIVE